MVCIPSTTIHTTSTTLCEKAVGENSATKRVEPQPHGDLFAFFFGRLAAHARWGGHGGPCAPGSARHRPCPCACAAPRAAALPPCLTGAGGLLAAPACASHRREAVKKHSKRGRQVRDPLHTIPPMPTENRRWGKIPFRSQSSHPCLQVSWRSTSSRSIFSTGLTCRSSRARRLRCASSMSSVRPLSNPPTLSTRPQSRAYSFPPCVSGGRRKRRPSSRRRPTAAYFVQLELAHAQVLPTCGEQRPGRRIPHSQPLLARHGLPCAPRCHMPLRGPVGGNSSLPSPRSNPRPALPPCLRSSARLRRSEHAPRRCSPHPSPRPRARSRCTGLPPRRALRGAPAQVADGVDEHALLAPPLPLMRA